MSRRTLLALGALLATPCASLAQCEVQTMLSTDFGVFGPFGVADHFGSSLAFENDLLVVGAPDCDVVDAQDGGAAYLYRRIGDTFEPVQKLVTPDTLPSSHFGSQVFVEAGIVSVLGIPGLSEFEFHSTNCWDHTELIDLELTDPTLPVTADMDGDVFVVATPQLGGFVGEAKVFLRGVDGWEADVTLANPALGSEILFGTAVAVDGDRIAISSDRAVHLYERELGTWVWRTSVATSTPGDGFGERIALSGDTLVVSVVDADPLDPQTGLPVTSNGCVNVYTHDGAGQWIESAQLIPSRMGVGIQAGLAVALDGDVLAVASAAADPAVSSGDVTLFELRDGSWIECGDPTPLDLGAFDEFGCALALEGGLMVAASPGHDELPWTDVGKAYTFTLDPIVDLGSGLAGHGGSAPELSVGPGLCPDELTSIALSGARPLSTAALLFGLYAIHAPFKGGVMVPAPDLLVPGLPTDAAGDLVLGLVWPAGFPGVTTWWQMAVADADAPLGWALSNAMEVTSGGF